MTGHNITQNRMTAGRAIISALALLAVFCGMAAAEQLYVNESGWWRDGGAFNASGSPIQAAVGAAAAGDSIYVHGGSYDENVDVDRRLTLEGEGADVVVVTAASSADHVFEVTADYVNASGFAVRGATSHSGIFLYNADYCNISGNNVSGNHCGIYIESSTNNTIENVTANSNEWGIYLIHSSNNTIKNNTANLNWYGIFLMSSSNYNTLTNNEANSNVQIGIHLLYSCNHNIIENNIVSSNDDRGIDLSGENNYNILTNNVANSSYRGIHMGNSNYNTLTENNVSLNSGYGVDMVGSDNNTLTENTVKSNGMGISLWCSDNNTITCNMIQNNEHYGFYCYIEAIGNNISYNNIIANGDYNGTSGGWEWQFYNYNDQSNLVEAKHNYWGAGMSNSTIDASIYDEEWWSGKVKFYPFETEPVPCAPGPKRPAFTTTDAVIALQIAAGSRPPDSRYDVSGDGSVTSLDALMILQAAAGKSEGCS